MLSSKTSESAPNKDETLEIKTDLDLFKMGELNSDEYLIKAIEGRKPREFVDPFPYTEPAAESHGDTTNRSPILGDPKGTTNATGANATGANVPSLDTSR